MSDEDKARLEHMLEAAQIARSFAEGEPREALDSDLKLRFALVRAIEIIGEAAATVTAEGQAAYPQIPWAPIIGMTNRPVHGYFHVNLNLVWETLTSDLPALIVELEKILSQP